MSLKGIFAYTIRAVGFAAVVGGAYWLILHMCGKKAKCADVLAIMYLSAAAEIIALRLGAGRVQRMIQWIPMKTTLEELRGGAWAFVYHVCGNLAWFVPLGMILAWKKPEWTLLQIIISGAAFSAMLELLQFALSTGMTDVDDVILNALGTIPGAICMRLYRKKKNNYCNCARNRI